GYCTSIWCRLTIASEGRICFSRQLCLRHPPEGLMRPEQGGKGEWLSRHSPCLAFGKPFTRANAFWPRRLAVCREKVISTFPRVRLRYESTSRRRRGRLPSPLPTWSDGRGRC